MNHSEAKLEKLRQDVDAIGVMLKTLLAQNQVTYHLATALAASHAQPAQLQQSFESLTRAVDDTLVFSTITDEDWALIHKFRDLVKFPA